MKTEQTQLTLHSALYQLQRLNAAIRLTKSSVAIWCPGRTIPRMIRRVITENKETVRAMIRLGRIEVCPSPYWHRKEWHYANEEWTTDSATCAVCQRLGIVG